MAVYAAMIAGMDRNIGRLVADLEAHGELDNTLVMFLSDNGGCAEWEPFGFDLAPLRADEIQPGVGINFGTPGSLNILHTPENASTMWRAEGMISYGSGWANASNTPWREYKHDCHEGGISGPLVVHWPARIRGGGQLRREAGHLIDILPTCLEVAGARYPQERAGHAVDPPAGKSLVASFAGGPIGHEMLAWEHEGNAALRAGDWKLVRHGPRGPWELYDLSSDRTELVNLADREPARVQSLARRWTEWAERTHVFPKPGANSGAKKK
jgi:arylsulfatase